MPRSSRTISVPRSTSAAGSRSSTSTCARARPLPVRASQSPCSALSRRCQLTCPSLSGAALAASIGVSWRVYGGTPCGSTSSPNRRMKGSGRMRRVRGASTTTVPVTLSSAVPAGTASTNSVAGSAETLLIREWPARFASPTARLTASIGIPKLAVVREARGSPDAERARIAVG